MTLIQYEVVLGHLMTVWELAERTLESWLDERQQEGKSGLPLDQLLMAMRQVAEGVDFLNKHGIYHRDIKPQNLFVLKGHAKIGDLGLAKEGTASTMSHTGMGSLGYMPPEVLAGKLHPSVDRYALAASYVRLRTGRHPFGPPNEKGVVFKRLERGECETEGMTPQEAAWVRQMLSPDPKQRPESAVRWVQELVRQIKGESAPVRVQPLAADAAGWASDVVSGFPSQGVLLVQGKTEQPMARLAEAVAAAEDGATIRLAAGEHRLAQKLVIGKSLTLLGPGPERCRVTCSDLDYVVKFTGNGKFAVEGIRFDHVGDQWADVLLEDSSHLELTNCYCTGAVWDAQNTRGGDGLWAVGTATGTVTGCLFERNGAHGIRLHDEAQLTIENCTCRENGQCGIAFFGHSTGIVRGNDCHGNKYVGIVADAQSWPTLEGNDCQRNGYYGIRFWASASGTARNNFCEGNGRGTFTWRRGPVRSWKATRDV